MPDSPPLEQRRFGGGFFCQLNCRGVKNNSVSGCQGGRGFDRTIPPGALTATFQAIPHARWWPSDEPGNFSHAPGAGYLSNFH